MTVLQTPRGFYPAAIMMGGRDVQGLEVNLTGPQPVQVVYKSDGGDVHGKIEQGAKLTVVLIPQEASPLKIAITGLCGPDGSFSIPDIPPGDYYAVALQNIAGIGTPAFKTFLLSNGMRIKVEPSSSTTLELRPARWP